MFSGRRRGAGSNRHRGSSWWRGRAAYGILVLAATLACVAGLTMLRTTDPFVVRTAREISFDMLQRLSPRIYQDAPVRFVPVAALAALQFAPHSTYRNHQTKGEQDEI